MKRVTGLSLCYNFLMILYKDNDQKFAIETLLIFLLPVLLIYYGVIPDRFRMICLVLVSLSVLFVIFREKWSLKDIGIRFDDFKKGIYLYLPLTVIGVVAISFYAEEMGMGTFLDIKPSVHLLLTFIPISFFQEFLYRGFMMKMLRSVFSDRMTVVLINASLFTILHIIFPLPNVMLPLAFIGGLYFAITYYLVPNLVLVSISHAVLNLVAVSLGFFVIS